MTQKTPRKLVPCCLSRILSHLFSKYPVNLLICLIMSPFHELTSFSYFYAFSCCSSWRAFYPFLILCMWFILKKTQAFSRRNQGSQHSPAITQSYHSSQKLGSVWIESLGLLSFLLEVKIDTSIEILRQISGQFLQPVDVAHLSPDTQSLTWLIWRQCDPSHFLQLQSRNFPDGPVVKTRCF